MSVRERIREVDHRSGVSGDVAGLLLVVARAEVEPELDFGRDETPDPEEPV